MGRLQKKKPAYKTKKTKSTALSDVSPQADGGTGAVKSKTVAASASKNGSLFKKKPAGTTRREPNFINKAMQFLREVKVEMKKVTWPTRKQTVGSTVVVIMLVFIIASFLGVVDFGLSGAVRVVLQ